MKIIHLRINEKDMDAIEDAFFMDLSEKEHKQILPKLRRVWKQLCEEMDECLGKEKQ